MTFLLAAFTAHQVFLPAPHPTQFGVRAAAKERRTHHAKDFPQELVLAGQTPFDLGHEVFSKPQVIEGLLEGRGGVLRLAAVTRKALLRFQATTLAGFGMMFSVSYTWRHRALLCAVTLFATCSLPKHT